MGPGKWQDQGSDQLGGSIQPGELRPADEADGRRLQTYPEEPTIYSVYGYQALQAAVDAVKRACTATDREKFRDALAETKLDALAGSVVFRSPRSEPNGENQGGSVIISRITGRDSYELVE